MRHMLPRCRWLRRFAELYLSDSLRLFVLNLVFMKLPIGVPLLLSTDSASLQVTTRSPAARATMMKTLEKA